MDINYLFLAICHIGSVQYIFLGRIVAAECIGVSEGSGILLFRGWMKPIYPRFRGNWAHLPLSSLELDAFFTECGETPLRGFSPSFLIALHQELPDLAQIGRNHTRGHGASKSIFSPLGANPIPTMMLQTIDPRLN